MLITHLNITLHVGPLFVYLSIVHPANKSVEAEPGQNS